MDRGPRSTAAWRVLVLVLVLVLVSLCTHAESRVAHPKTYSREGVHLSSQARGRVPPPEPRRPSAAPPPPPPPRPRPVAVHCQPDTMEVLVQADLFDSGLEVNARHLRLGSNPPAEGGACGAAQSADAQFTLRSHLMDCGIQLSHSKDKIIYSTVVVYSPEPSDGGLLRLDGATIPVECHYDKYYSLNSIPLHPTWLPLVSIASAEDRIDFNLLLTTADWHYKREVYSYFLGDQLHFELSAVVRAHTPLKVYVDHCVGTATPDAEAPLRYDFIENGCLADAYLTNSTSHFLPRVAEDRLRFQVDAFRFYHESSTQIYVTCFVKAVPVSVPPSSQNRACSLIDSRWRSVDGNHDACASCDLAHQEVPRPSDVFVGAKEPPFVMSHQSLTHNRPEQAGTLDFKVGAPHRAHIRHSRLQQPLTGPVKRGAAAGAAGAAGARARAAAAAGRSLQLGPITILTSRQPHTSPARSKRWSKGPSA